MSVARRADNKASFRESQYAYVGPIDRTADDVLLNALEVQEGWEVTEWQLRRLVKEGQLRRVRRPGNQPYYPLSAVESILGKPKRPFTPRYRRGFELGELAA